MRRRFGRVTGAIEASEDGEEELARDMLGVASEVRALADALEWVLGGGPGDDADNIERLRWAWTTWQLEQNTER